MIAAGGAACALAGAVVLLVVASGKSGSPLVAPTVARAVTAPFPAPPRGAIVFAREDGADVLALAVVRHPGGVTLQTSVIGGQGHGVRGLGVSFGAFARGAVTARQAIVCGAGCYRADLPAIPALSAIVVTVKRSPGTTRWRVSLPAVQPAPDATALMARATSVWAHLQSLSYVDRLTSDPSHTVVSHWRVVAPDRLAYEIEQGSQQTVIVGTRRWDRSQGGGWQRSPAVLLHQPQPFWVEVRDAHVVGSGRIGSRPVWLVTFFDPRTPAWFLASVDKRTARTRDIRMWASAHFMHDTYGQFDAPLEIIPPTP
jgi:hypothetical protein